MAHSFPTALAALLFMTCASAGQPQVLPPSDAPASAQPPISPECQQKHQQAAVRASLDGILDAISSKRTARILAIGSSSTVGVGATSPAASYPERLEDSLEDYFKGRNLEVIARGVSGEVAQGAAERIRFEVAEERPDLVLWQVGTNDALARIPIEEFDAAVRSTLDWLKASNIDVILIDPQFVEELADDDYYLRIVAAIAEIAKDENVALVSRFHIMKELASRRNNGDLLAKDHLHLNDLGYRCMAEYVSRTIVSGVLQAQTDTQNAPPSGSKEKN